MFENNKNNSETFFERNEMKEINTNLISKMKSQRKNLIKIEETTMWRSNLFFRFSKKNYFFGKKEKSISFTILNFHRDW